MFKNLKIKKKLIFSFLLISILCIAMGLLASYNLKTLDQSDTELYDEMTVPLYLIGDISTIFEQSRVKAIEAINAQTPAEIKQKTDEIQAMRNSVSELLKQFEAIEESDDMKAAQAEFVEARKVYGAGLDKIVALSTENRDAEALAMTAADGELTKGAALEQAAIKKIMEIKVNEAKAKSDANTAAANRTIMMTMIIAAIVFVLSILIGLYISGLITKPLNKVVYMLSEMSKGHLKERLNLDTADEIGVMARTMDAFADELQSNVIGVMNQISRGDMSAIITAKDSQDEISPALKKTLDTVKNLNVEIERNIKAVTEGKLDTRANADLYSGTWKELILGINGLIDAFVGPINLTAEYVERISKGNIPPKITDT